MNQDDQKGFELKGIITALLKESVSSEEEPMFWAYFSDMGLSLDGGEVLTIFASPLFLDMRSRNRDDGRNVGIEALETLLSSEALKKILSEKNLGFSKVVWKVAKPKQRPLGLTRLGDTEPVKTLREGGLAGVKLPPPARWERQQKQPLHAGRRHPPIPSGLDPRNGNQPPSGEQLSLMPCLNPAFTLGKAVFGSNGDGKAVDGLIKLLLAGRLVPPGLHLFGSSGSGKTFFAHAITHAASKVCGKDGPFRSVVSCDGQRWYVLFQSTIREGARWGALEDFKQSHLGDRTLFVLDGIDAILRGKKKRTLAELADIIKSITGLGGKTVLTSEFPLPENSPLACGLTALNIDFPDRSAGDLIASWLGRRVLPKSILELINVSSDGRSARDILSLAQEIRTVLNGNKKRHMIAWDRMKKAGWEVKSTKELIREWADTERKKALAVYIAKVVMGMGYVAAGREIGVGDYRMASRYFNKVFIPMVEGNAQVREELKRACDYFCLSLPS